MQNQRTSIPELGPEIAAELSTADFQPFPSPARPKIAPRRNLGRITIASKRQPGDSQRPGIVAQLGLDAAPRSRMGWKPVFLVRRADLRPTRGAKPVPGLFGERVLCWKQRTCGILDPSYVLASSSHPRRTPRNASKHFSDATNPEPTHANTGILARSCTRNIHR